MSGLPSEPERRLQKARVGRRHGSAPQGTPGSTAAGGQSGGNPRPSRRSLLGSKLRGSAEPTVGLSSFTPLPSPVLSPPHTALPVLEAT